MENQLKAAALAARIPSHGPFADGKSAVEFVKGHSLLKLARKSGIKLSPDTTRLLERLTHFTVWAGRYHVPIDRRDALFERTTRDRDLAEIKAFIAAIDRVKPWG